MMGNVLSVWGSPGSGKTTFATKLATAIYEKYQKTVIVLYCDIETPVLPVVFPNFKREYLASVGVALSKAELLQNDVIQCLVTIKGKPNFGFLGFRDGENKNTFPRFTRNKVEDLIDTLRGISDYIIADCTSNLENNILAATALELADMTFRLTAPELKSISWNLSQMPLYADKKYHCQNHVQGINVPNADVLYPIEETKAHMRDVAFLMPYSAAVKTQMQEGRLYFRSGDRGYDVCMNQIAERVVRYASN